jgi:hypothetical protein
VCTILDEAESYAGIEVMMLMMMVLAQLLRIEEDLGSKAAYAGATFRKPAWMA